MEVLIVRQNLDLHNALKVNRDMLTWLIEESSCMNISRELFVSSLSDVHCNLAIILDSFEKFFNDSKK